MRKIILGVAISLDGFIEGPNGEFDWCFTDQDYGMNEFLQSVDAIFFGRKSYEVLMRMDGGAQMFPGKKNYVFSTQATIAVPGETVVVSGDIKNEVSRIKAEPGKNIWLFGGALLTRELMQYKLVDELWLSIHPVLLGSGKSIFEGNRRTKLELTSSRTYDTGLVSVRYAVK